MKLLVDECLPELLVQEFVSRGHDAVWARRVCPGVTDTRVLEVARAEARIVVTEDRDFGKLTMLLKLPAIAVVIAHASDFPGSLSEVVAALADTVEQLDTQLIGRLTTIEPGRIRQRALPGVP